MECANALREVNWLEKKELEQEGDSTVQQVINSECYDFVVGQCGGQGWLRLWQASKLREKRQESPKHYLTAALSSPDHKTPVVKKPAALRTVTPTVIETQFDSSPEVKKKPVSKWMTALTKERNVK